METFKTKVDYHSVDYSANYDHFTGLNLELEKIEDQPDEPKHEQHEQSGGCDGQGTRAAQEGPRPEESTKKPVNQTRSNPQQK